MNNPPPPRPPPPFILLYPLTFTPIHPYTSFIHVSIFIRLRYAVHPARMRGKLDVYGNQQVVEIGCQVASGGIRENLADLSETDDCVAFTVESIKVKRVFSNKR